MTSDRGAADTAAFESGSRTGRHISLVHRIGAVVFALGLGTFGVLGLVDQLAAFDTTTTVLGLSSNLLLSLVSLIVGAVLVLAAVRGGRTASTVLVGVGAAFLLSGVVNVVLLDTPFNVLAFRMPNVIFSLVAGGLLIVLGSYGRFVLWLPDDNPYQQQRHPGDTENTHMPTVYPGQDDATAVREMADAERAVARHSATPEQAAGVHAIRDVRTAEDRLVAWRTATEASEQQPPAG